MLLVHEKEHTERGSTSLLAQVAVIIPTFNAERHWVDLQAALKRQGLCPEQVLIVDSTSTDRTAVLARGAGFGLVQIPQCRFNHGGTRQAACAHLPWAEFLVFLTQDATPASASSVLTLCQAFEEPEVGATYGRQLPRYDADPIERHARLFNYPPGSQTRTFAHRDALGLRAAFLSNSFAAYRRSALEQVGGFPTDVILAEDSVVAARMLVAGWCLAYTADAAVVHSHDMPFRQEFSRYFDTGVHHTREAWLLEEFGGAGGEGRRFVASELKYLWNNARTDIPQSVVRNLSKWSAYQLGRRERYLSLGLKRRISSSPNFWEGERIA